jgi:hypothetical protein
MINAQITIKSTEKTRLLLYFSKDLSQTTFYSTIHVNVKQSRYRPGEAQRVPGS